MRPTLTINLLLFVQIFFTMNSLSQQEIKTIKGEFFIGYDAWGITENLLFPGKYTINGKIGWLYRQNFQISSELGYMNFSKMLNDSLKSYDYKSNGYYLRLGYEYNIFKRNAANERNFILIGVHAGYSITRHRADNILISDKIWGARNFSFPENKSNHAWIDASMSIRSQILKHLSIGWEITLSRIVFSQNNEINKPYYIGGFGKSKNNFSLGFHYYLFLTLGY